MTNNCDDEAEDLWSTSGAVCEAEVVQAVTAIERPLLLCVWLAEDGFSFLCFCLAAVAASWECCKINSSWRHSCWALVSAYCLRGRRLGSATRGGGWAPSPCLAHALCCKLKGECGEITHTPKTGRGYAQRECIWLDGITFYVMLFKCTCFRDAIWLFFLRRFWLEWEMNGAMCGERGKLQRSLIQLWHISECVFCVCVFVCVHLFVLCRC